MRPLLAPGGAVAALLAATAAGLAWGPASLPLGGVISEIASHLPLLHVRSTLVGRQATILWQIRAPRVALGGLVGGMLSLGGAAYQGVFRNPLADPYLLGVAAGAGLGATTVIAYGPGAGIGRWTLLPLAAFVGALAAVVASYLLGSSVGGRRSVPSLILGGVAVSAFFSAAQTFVQQRHAETLRQVFAWILGGLNTVGWGEVWLALPYVVLASLVILAHRRLLDVLAVGDTEAASLGVPAARVRFTVVVAATLGTAAVVSVSGLIGFVGIVVPHALRLLAGPSYRRLLPLSLVAGAAFLIAADLAARTAAAPAELPLGVVTALVGAPFFLVVLRTNRLAGI